MRESVPALTFVAWLTGALVAVDFVDALAIIARVFLTVVKIYLTVCS